VIVRCERCETRFRLDESRLPARGARVRCSRCKHAFFVASPQASRGDWVDAAAREAVERERAAPPEVAWDLEERQGAGDAPPSPGAVPAPAREAAEETEWRFEEEAGAEAASAHADAPSPGEASLDALGAPESWDLLASARGAAREKAPAPVVEPAAAVTGDAAPGLVPDAGRLAAAREEAPAPHAAALVEQAAVVRSRLPALAGWLAVALLGALALAGALRGAPDAAAVSFASVGGFEVVEARARALETLREGEILVVSGRLRNPGPGARAIGAPLVVLLHGADGRPLPQGRAAAGPTLAPAQLRTEDPARLGREQERLAAALARRRFAPQAEIGFTAVFPDPPEGAARFTLALGAGERPTR
jgi:predicted Zn finger-like uncharacterized protein